MTFSKQDVAGASMHDGDVDTGWLNCDYCCIPGGQSHRRTGFVFLAITVVIFQFVSSSP
jgi:hypothetical protein